MTALVNFFNSVARKDEGQDLLEYALLVALIALVAVGAVTAAGTRSPGSSTRSPARSSQTSSAPGPPRMSAGSGALSLDAPQECECPSWIALLH